MTNRLQVQRDKLQAYIEAARVHSNLQLDEVRARGACKALLDDLCSDLSTDAVVSPDGRHVVVMHRGEAIIRRVAQ